MRVKQRVMAHSYFEIVFDNSGSMNENLAGSTRLEVAKELFVKDIFPLINDTTEVAVRLLRNGCSGESYYRNFGSNRNECLSFIRGIQIAGDTPLFNTMKDALSTTLNSGAQEKTIFVLTDGGDTCSLPIESVLSREELKYFKQINVILAQFAVSNGPEVNQLSHLANTLGAKTFNFASGEKLNLSSIRTELKTALNAVGMNRSEPLRHCYEDMVGDDLNWKQLETMGILVHQARVLYDEGFLSWKPVEAERVSALQFAELKFLYGIRFKSGINGLFMRSMLSQLVKPYYYHSKCIYWDFDEARWKYFPQPAPIVVEKIVEKEVEKEVKVEVVREVFNREKYRKSGCYMVRSKDEWDENQLMPGRKDSTDSQYFQLNLCDYYKPKVVVIREGDILKYETKKPKGRPRKDQHL